MMLENVVRWHQEWGWIALILHSVRVSPTNKVRAVEHFQVLRTSRHPDRRIDLALPHQQFRKPLTNLQHVHRMPNYCSNQ